MVFCMSGLLQYNKQGSNVLRDGASCDFNVSCFDSVASVAASTFGGNATSTSFESNCDLE